MRNSQIKWMFFLVAVSVICISIIQVYWVRKAYVLEDKDFNYKVHIALRNTAINYWEWNNIEPASYDVVSRIERDYYVVQIDDQVEPEFVQHLLKVEFEKQQLITDFEFCFYDCMEDSVMARFLIARTGEVTPNHENPNYQYPKLNRDNYYFGVHFPHRNEFVIQNMGPWVVFTIFIILLFAFLVYIVMLVLKQKRLSEIQKDFVNNMTHEFKTPLAAIQLSAEVLKHPEITKKPQRLLSYATIIDSEASRLGQQIERVLEMAHAEKGDLFLHKKRIALKQLLEQVVQHYDGLIQQKELIIEQVLPEEEIWINVDALHMENVFSNLIDNAIKYRSSDIPRVIITVKKKKNKVFISLQDNGVGIEEEHHKLLFDKFYRVPTGNVHNVKGFGLGLNYVQIILHSHDGDIKCFSKLGAGSTFTITLPILK